MSTEVTLPALGESVTEGTVSRWLKEVGEHVVHSHIRAEDAKAAIGGGELAHAFAWCEN